jgi:hypothetical protein
MSRKKAEKSNVHLGIFTDRSADYNLAILETLLPEEATSWQIAENLQKKRKPCDNIEAIYYRTQKIYSVIQRKTGRLADLKRKGYIVEKNGKWKLTKKGLIALSVTNPDLVANEIRTKRNKLLYQFKEEISAIPNETLREPIGIQIDLSKMKPMLAKIDPTEFLTMLLEEAKMLLLEGIELDRISEQDFLDLLKGRRSLQEKVTQIVEEIEKNGSS